MTSIVCGPIKNLLSLTTLLKPPPLLLLLDLGDAVSASSKPRMMVVSLSMTRSTDELTAMLKPEFA